MNAIFGIISLSLWFFEIISGVPWRLPSYDLLFETDVGRSEVMSCCYLMHEQKYLQQIY